MTVELKLNLDLDRALLTLAYVQTLDAKERVSTPATQAVSALKTVTNEVQKAARKPRADAGKPRGSYKNTEEGVVEPKQVQAHSEPSPAAVEEKPAPTSAPISSGAVEGTLPASSPSAPSVSTASASVVPTKLTIDDARASMAKLNEALGMQACLDALQRHGTARLSELSTAQYADFIQYCDEEVAKKKLNG